MRKFVPLMFTALILIAPAFARQKPKVRAITAFVRIEQAHYQDEVRDTLAFLRKAKAAFEQRWSQGAVSRDVAAGLLGGVRHRARHHSSAGRHHG
jgi:hypothetical protein